MRAAGAGNVPMLEWMVQQGCPLDESACRSAAERGHLSALKFLVQQAGCPIDVDMCILAADKHPECQEWLWTLLPE
jgi:hypothetical protein